MDSAIQEKLSERILAILDKWDANLKDSTSWFDQRKSDLVNGAMFLVSSVDDLINLVEEFVISGPDKKQLVLESISKIYDYIIAEAMPFFLKPFNPYIKNFIVDFVISNLIDFFVNKYNEGLWGDNNNDGSSQVSSTAA